jgi:hypothetical protein
MTAEQADADLDELVERAEEYFQPNRNAQMMGQPSKLVEFMKTADPRIPKGLWHMEGDTFFAVAQELEELSLVGARGHGPSMGLVDSLLICLCLLLSGVSWTQMTAHLKLWSRSGFQRGVTRCLRPLADYARDRLDGIADFRATGHYDIYPTAYILTTMELPLRADNARDAVLVILRLIATNQPSGAGRRF